MSGRVLVRIPSLLLPAALVLTGAHVMADPPVMPAAAAAEREADSGPLERPDAMSASVTARVTGRQVEDLSKRSETTQVFANPDGSWTNETADGPVRVLDDAGEWHDIDTTLVQRDGGLEPRFAATDVRFSDGGDKQFAQMSEVGKDLAWKWPTVLPEPELDGNTATYVGAVEGGDLVVTALPTGFTHSVILHERPASLDALAETLAGAAGDIEPDTATDPGPSAEEPSDPVATAATAEEAAPPADPVLFSMQVATDGAKLSETGAGGLQVKTTDGEVVVEAPRPLMWDAETDPSGDPVNVIPVETTVTAPGQTTPEGSTAGAAPVLTLTPDEEFLADPDTQYPVTIDPTYTAPSPSGDTFVQNTGSYTSGATVQSWDHFRTGTQDSGAHIARTFIKFPTIDFRDKILISAELRARVVRSLSCTNGSTVVYRPTANWALNTVTWANQPAVANVTPPQYYLPHGGPSGCAPHAWAKWNVLSMVQAWKNGGTGNGQYGFRLSTATETANGSYREFRSRDGSPPDTTYHPKLVITYNRAPATPTPTLPAAAASYTAPGSSTPTIYVQDSKPTFSTTVSDPDGGNVQGILQVYNAATHAAVSYCYTGNAASGQNVSCTVDNELQEGIEYYVKATAHDGSNYTGGSTSAAGAVWSSPKTFKLAKEKPASPIVSCPTPYTNGSWASTAPGGAVTCTVTASGTGASAPVTIKYSVDHGAEETKSINPSVPAEETIPVSIPTTDGGHGIVATAISPSGKSSDATDYGFGWGAVGLTLPLAEKIETTTDTVALEAAGPPSNGGAGEVEASVKWRVAGTDGNYLAGWNEDTNTELKATNTASGVHVTGTWNTGNAVTDNGIPGSPVAVDPDRPVLLDIQVCINYPGDPSPGNCSWSSTERQVLRVAHAFGGNFPTSEVPGGEVALWTGELAIAGTDATVTATGADLSVSRTAASFAGPVANPANQVFGPGWNASLDGPDAGLGDLTLIDSTLVDGTLQLVDGVGTAMIFAANEVPDRRTTADLVQGDWVAIDEDTQLSGTTLHVDVTGGATTVTVTEDDGTVTTYIASSVPNTDVAGVFTVSGIADAAAEGATTYSRDGQGRIIRILAPKPAGVSCAAPATPPATDPNLAAGCRALKITYATSTTATPSTDGDAVGQVKQIEQVIGGTPAQTSTILATFKYDGDHRLVEATDPRTNLTTAYAYDDSDGTSDRIASVTPAGLEPIHYAYDADDKLARVTRQKPGGGTASLATVVYDVPVNARAGGTPDGDQLDELPDLTGTVSDWEQSAAPTYGMAVFGPDQPFDQAETSVSVAEVADEAANGAAWRDASLTYTDADGRILNTAAFGAGQWLYTATTYDEHDNIVRSLDAADIAAIQAGQLNAAMAGDLTVYNNEIKVGEDVVLPAGTVITDTYATARWIRDASGSLELARPHIHTDYDENAPTPNGINPATGQRYALPTTVTSNAVHPDTKVVIDTYSVTTSNYSDSITGGTAQDGWAMGLAGTRTTVMAGSAGATTTDIKTKTLYDATGRVIETRQPKSVTGAGTDPGTRKTYYYSTDAQTTPAGTNCGGKPQWAGAICETAYAGGTPTLVRTKISAYDALLNPLTTVETSGAAVRTTTNTYTVDGKPHETTVAMTGLSSSVPIGKTTASYHPATGLPWKTETAAAGSNPAGTVTIGYDSWGRQTTYSPAAGEATTTSYNGNGDVAEVEDSGGNTTTYTYDTVEADGQVEEHRGLPTKVSISRPTGAALEFTGVYNAAGALVRQNLPGGMIQRTSYDPTGEPLGLTYSGPVDETDPETGGVINTTPNVTWLAWSQNNDGLGRVRREWTPTGASFSADVTGAAATGFARDYTYDRAARLVRVKDQTLPAGAGTLNDGDVGSGLPDTACQIRDYKFDANGNRETKTTNTSALGQPCPTTSAGEVTKTWTVDAGDRVTNAPGGGAYVYDLFGRQTKIPQTDTPSAAAGGAPGDATLTYYDDDSVESIAQNGTSTSFKLDAAGRRSVSTSTTAGVSTALTRHYTDNSDNPAWTSTSTGGGTPVIERFAEDLGGGLGLTITDGAASLQISDLHGDVVSSVDVSTSGSPQGLASWSDTDEYGNPLLPATTGKTPTNSSGVAGGLGYGWLGNKQRATDSSGLILMGVRVYNPITGAFTSTDPVLGGNSAAYAYPQDPMNMFDLTGEWGWGGIKKGLKKAGKWASTHKTDIALTAISFAPGGLAVRGAYTAYRGYRAYKATTKVKSVVRAVTKTVKSSCKRNSFDFDTPVLMADGSQKPIAEVELGDLVWASDPETGDVGPREVADLIRHTGLHQMVAVTLANGTSIDATDEHPFWVLKRRTGGGDAQGTWVDAIDLQAGDQLLSADRNILEVANLAISFTDLTAYNLTVAGLHTYYAGHEPVLVHNDGCDPRDLKGMKEPYLEKVLKRHDTDPHTLKYDYLGKKTKVAQYDINKCSKCGRLNIVKKRGPWKPMGTHLYD